MNSVPQYQAAIGCYAPIAQNAQNMHKLRQTLHVTELYDSYDHMIHIYAKLLRHMIISFAGIYEYVFYACLRLRLILLAILPFQLYESEKLPFLTKKILPQWQDQKLKYWRLALLSSLM